MNSLEQESRYGYLEHAVIDSHGFKVVDATATGPRAHDDLIWVGKGTEGRWLTPAEALHLSESIRNVVASHHKRHGDVALMVLGHE